MNIGVASQIRLEDRIAVVKNKKGKETAIPYKEPYLDVRIVAVADDGEQTILATASGYVYSRLGEIDYRFKFSDPKHPAARRMANKGSESLNVPMDGLKREVRGVVGRYGPEVMAAVWDRIEFLTEAALADRKEHKIASRAKRLEELKAA